MENDDNGDTQSIHPHVHGALFPLLNQIARDNDYEPHRITTLTIGHPGSHSLPLNGCSIDHIALILSHHKLYTVTHLCLINVALQQNDTGAMASMKQFLENNQRLTKLTMWSSGMPPITSNTMIRNLMELRAPPAGSIRRDQENTDCTILECMAAALSRNSSITSLKLCHYDFARNASALQGLGHLLESKTNFKSIEFEECALDHDNFASVVNHVTKTAQAKFLEGLAMQSELEYFGLQFCRLSDRTGANILKFLSNRRRADNFMKSDIKATTASLRCLSFCKCASFGRTTFQSLNNFLMAQHEERSSSSLPWTCHGLEELEINVDIDQVEEGDNNGQVRRCWDDEWRHDFSFVLSEYNDSLQRLHLVLKGGDDRTVSPQLRYWQEHLTLVIRRNRAIGAVRNSFLLANNPREPKRHSDSLPSRCGNHIGLAVYGQALVKLIAKNSSTQTQSGRSAREAEIGLSAAFLTLSVLLPKLCQR